VFSVVAVSLYRTSDASLSRLALRLRDSAACFSFSLPSLLTLQTDQSRKPERNESDQSTEHVPGDDDHPQFIIDYRPQDFLDAVDTERHHFSLYHPLNVEPLHEHRQLSVDPFPDMRRRRVRKLASRVRLLAARGDVANDLGNRFLEICEQSIVNRARDLFADHRLVEQINELLHALRLDGVERRLEFPLAHHQL